MGTVLLPGSAFVELALAAAERVGVRVVEREFTLQAPLVFAEGGALQVQLVLSERDEEGGRRLGIYSRTESRRERTGARRLGPARSGCPGRRPQPGGWRAQGVR